MEFLFLALEFSIFQDSLNHFSNNIRLQRQAIFYFFVTCHENSKKKRMK